MIMDEEDFKRCLKDKTNEINEIIKTYLPAEEGAQKTVIEALNYSVLAGGKRLRPMLMKEVYTLLGGRSRIVEPFMAAIEFIHTYSLVHDDLPAMDNDEYRRGQFTTWRVYGDGMGVLAGDALLNYAFETMLSASSMKTEYEDIYSLYEAMQIISKKSGIYGMVGGQCADLEAEDEKSLLSEEALLFIHEHKTAALIQAAMMAGAILAGADLETIAGIERCAYNIGIAFQIRDDILDVIGDDKELGKSTGSDAENGKQTYVTLHGIEKSEEEVHRLSDEAMKILDSLGGNNDFIKALVAMLVGRRY